MTNPPNIPESDLQEVANRYRVARQMIVGLRLVASVDVWHGIETALADLPALLNQTTRLRIEVSIVRLNRANLAAAALATLDAERDGEPDPLSYLRDELSAQGYKLGDGQ